MSDADTPRLDIAPALEEQTTIRKLIAPALLHALQQKNCTPGNWHRISIDVRMGVDGETVDIASMTLVKQPKD